MRKVYVLGAGDSDIQKIREITSIPDNVEIVCISSMENIPIEEQFNSDIATVRQIHKFSAPPLLPLMPYISTDRKTKGYERPYKFHK